MRTKVQKQYFTNNFFSPNKKKILLFLSTSVLIPLPFNGGLVGGIAPTINALPSILLMSLFSLMSLQTKYFLFFLSEATLLLLIDYTIACSTYYILQKINDKTPWTHLISTIVILFIIYLTLKISGIISVTA